MNEDLLGRLRLLATEYATRLEKRTAERLEEMLKDDVSHLLIYRVLGIPDAEGTLIDLYQNKGRFLYQYAGSFLERATKLCFQLAYPTARSAVRIPNPFGTRPATFEIDLVIESDALEIKWRDATTDGDHIVKEANRLRAIQAAGFTPIRIMFFYPNRTQAIKIQRALEITYQELGGAYYHRDAAWTYIKDRTGFDLQAMLQILATERGNEV